MQTHSAENVTAITQARPNATPLEQARCWIGQRLVLRKPLAGFEPGIECIVVCVVDFGDGLLLWIATDNYQANDVDQIEIDHIFDYFRLAPLRPSR